jgi:hypothetical protein
MSSLARSALWYARHGWRVFPCLPGDKKPAIKGWPKLATADLAQVAAWWRVRPDSNIGIACGPLTGLYVLDVDQHGIDGEQALAALVDKLGPLPATVEQRTGSGGRQLLFACPANRDMRNKAGAAPRPGQSAGFRLPAGLDTRGEGGFVVVPPSLHPCGQRYRWIVGPHQTAPADLPEPWVEALERRRHVTITVPVTPLRHVTGQDIAALLRFVATQREGNRNAALYWAARKVEELRRLGLIAGDGAHELRSAARAAGLDEVEAARTIASAKRAEGGQ